SRRVRAVALDLLARLPESGLVQRMMARVRPLVHIKRGLLRPQLDLTLPTAPDASAVRDGVLRTPPAGQQIGGRQWWLRQMIWVIVPAGWHETYGLSPPALVTLAQRSGWDAVLIACWSTAVTRLPSREWCEALLRLSPSQHGVLSALPPAER